MNNVIVPRTISLSGKLPFEVFLFSITISSEQLSKNWEVLDIKLGMTELMSQTVWLWSTVSNWWHQYKLVIDQYKSTVFFKHIFKSFFFLNYSVSIWPNRAGLHLTLWQFIFLPVFLWSCSKSFSQGMLNFDIDKWSPHPFTYLHVNLL